MARQEGLLQAIIDNPDDDSVRLVFADWLEDNAEAGVAEAENPYLLWAQLIRGQVQFSRLLIEPEHAFRQPGFFEVLSLVPPLRGVLLEPFGQLAPFLGDPDQSSNETILTTVFGFWIRRGMVEGLEIYGGQTAALFTRDAATIADQVPLRHLRVHITASRNTTDPRRDPIRVHTLRALLDQEFISRLRTLDLSPMSLGEQAAACLLRYHSRLKLTRLHLQAANLRETTRQQLQEAFGVALDMPVFDDDIPF